MRRVAGTPKISETHLLHLTDKSCPDNLTSRYRKVPREDRGANSMQSNTRPRSGSTLEMPLSRRRPITIWTNDFHISTIGTVKALLRPRGVEFIDKSLSV